MDTKFCTFLQTPISFIHHFAETQHQLVGDIMDILPTEVRGQTLEITIGYKICFFQTACSQNLLAAS